MNPHLLALTTFVVGILFWWSGRRSQSAALRWTGVGVVGLAVLGWLGYLAAMYYLVNIYR